MTGAVEITRNSSRAARGLVSVQSRLNQVVDESSSTGKKLTEWYKEHNIELYDQQGQLRSLYDVLGDVSKQWGTLTKNEKDYYLNQQAGANQTVNLSAILDNFNHVAEATSTAYDSAGSAAKENAAFVDSYAGKVQDLSRAWQSLSTAVIDGGAAKGIVGALADIVEGLSESTVGVTAIQTLLGTGAIWGGAELLKAGGIIKTIAAQFSGIAESAGATSGILAALGGITLPQILATVGGLIVGFKGIRWVAEQFSYEHLSDSAQEAEEHTEELINEQQSLRDEFKELEKRQGSLSKQEQARYEWLKKNGNLADEILASEREAVALNNKAWKARSREIWESNRVFDDFSQQYKGTWSTQLNDINLTMQTGTKSIAEQRDMLNKYRAAWQPIVDEIRDNEDAGRELTKTDKDLLSVWEDFIAIEKEFNDSNQETVESINNTSEAIDNLGNKTIDLQNRYTKLASFLEDFGAGVDYSDYWDSMAEAYEAFQEKIAAGEYGDPIVKAMINALATPEMWDMFGGDAVKLGQYLAGQTVDGFTYGFSQMLASGKSDKAIQAFMDRFKYASDGMRELRTASGELAATIDRDGRLQIQSWDAVREAMGANEIGLEALRALFQDFSYDTIFSTEEIETAVANLQNTFGKTLDTADLAEVAVAVKLTLPEGTDKATIAAMIKELVPDATDAEIQAILDTDAFDAVSTELKSKADAIDATAKIKEEVGEGQASALATQVGTDATNAGSGAKAEIKEGVGEGQAASLSSQVQTDATTAGASATATISTNADTNGVDTALTNYTANFDKTADILTDANTDGADAELDNYLLNLTKQAELSTKADLNGVQTDLETVVAGATSTYIATVGSDFDSETAVTKIDALIAGYQDELKFNPSLDPTAEATLNTKILALTQARDLIINAQDDGSIDKVKTDIDSIPTEKNIFVKIKLGIEKAANWIGEAATTAGDWISDAANSIWDGITGLFSTKAEAEGGVEFPVEPVVAEGSYETFVGELTFEEPPKVEVEADASAVEEESEAATEAVESIPEDHDTTIEGDASSAIAAADAAIDAIAAIPDSKTITISGVYTGIAGGVGGNKMVPRAHGVKSSQGEIALVNDGSPVNGSSAELIVDKDRAFIAGGGKETIVPLSKGATVYSAAETQQILQNSKGISTGLLNQGIPSHRQEQGAGGVGKATTPKTLGTKIQLPTPTPSPSGGGGGGGDSGDKSKSSSSSSSSKDAWKEEFEKWLKERKHLLAMDLITEKEYYDSLEEMYKKYFSDLTKYQDEYWKYEEEVYKYRKQELEDTIKLEEALSELAKAKTQKVLVYKDGHFQYMQNIEAIARAQQEVNSYANGTTNAKAGLDLVGENGPELRVLNHDGIIPADITKNLLRLGTMSIGSLSGLGSHSTDIFNIDRVVLENVNNVEDIFSGLKNLALQRATSRI